MCDAKVVAHYQGAMERAKELGCILTVTPDGQTFSVRYAEKGKSHEVAYDYIAEIEAFLRGLKSGRGLD